MNIAGVGEVLRHCGRLLAALSASLLTVNSGCKSHPTVNSVSSATSAAAQAPAPALADPLDESWKPALRLADYAAAAQAFDRVHPQPNSPGLRYVRARLAFEQQDAARALQLSEQLVGQLPLFTSEIERLRLWAAAQARPDLEVAGALAKSGQVSELMQAAELYQRLGHAVRAQEVAEAAVSLAARGSRAVWAKARKLRAELAEQRGDSAQATADWRWLTLEAPTDPAAQGADIALERVQRSPLTAAQRYTRAEAFTEGGQLAAALQELTQVLRAPGPRPSATDLLRTRAWAHFKSRQDYAQAARLFAEVARKDARYRVQDLFYSARALSRAQRDHEAIVAYRALAQRYPKSAFAEEATFLVGRLHEVLGHWEKAIVAHQATLRRYAKSDRFTEKARYGIALSALALKDGTLAERYLKQLQAAEPAPRRAAQLEHLLGVAQQLQGKDEAAVATFQRVISEHPLSWAALMSVLRLQQAGVSPAALIAPAEAEPAEPPLRLQWPAKVQWLADWGLEHEAEQLLALEAEGLQQRYAPRGAEALCEAYALLAPAKHRYRHAQRAVRERALQRAISERTRWLWDCIYPKPYLAEVTRLCEQLQLAPELVYAVMRQESAFDSGARSGAGAVGLMQLMPATAQQVAEKIALAGELDLRTPALNLRLGATLLEELLMRFDSAPLAFAAYNAGSAAVERWLAAAGMLPLDLFVAYIPYEETREYVQRVTGNWARYSYVAGGERALPSLRLALPARGLPEAPPLPTPASSRAN